MRWPWGKGGLIAELRAEIHSLESSLSARVNDRDQIIHLEREVSRLKAGERFFGPVEQMRSSRALGARSSAKYRLTLHGDRQSTDLDIELKPSETAFLDKLNLAFTGAGHCDGLVEITPWKEVAHKGNGINAKAVPEETV